jgi:hypothetical protein
MSHLNHLASSKSSGAASPNLENFKTKLVEAAESAEMLKTHLGMINKKTLEGVAERSLQSAINWAVRAVASSNGNTDLVVRDIRETVARVLATRPNLNGGSERLLEVVEGAIEKTIREKAAGKIEATLAQQGHI